MLGENASQRILLRESKRVAKDLASRKFVVENSRGGFAKNLLSMSWFIRGPDLHVTRDAYVVVRKLMLNRKSWMMVEVEVGY